MNDHFYKRRSFLIFLILILGFLAHSLIIDNSFKALDDQYSIVNNQDIKNFANIGKIFSRPFFMEPSYYRPLVSLSFMLEYHAFGLNASFYYLSNLLIHLGVSILIFAILRLFFLSPFKAFAVSLLFAIHPIHWEAVGHISARAILLSSFFYLGSFYLFCWSIRKYFSWPILILSLGSFGLALLSKESAITLPVLLGSYTFILYRKDNSIFIPALKRVLFYVGVVVIYFFLRYSLGITKVYVWSSLPQAFLGFLTFLYSVIIHLKRLVWPLGLYFDRSEMIFSSFVSAKVLGTIVFFSIFLISFFQFRKKISALVIFWILWFVIHLATVSQLFFPIGVQPGVISTADHFLYLPALGIFVLFVMAVGSVINRNLNINRKLIYLTAASVYMFFFIMSVQQSLQSRDQIYVLQKTLRYAPYNNRVQNSLALAFAQHGLFNEAEKNFRHVLQRDPLNVLARIGLAKALCDQNQYWEGIQEYEKITEAGKFKDLLNENLTLSYNILIDRYQRRLEQEPNNALLHYSLGVVYAKRRNWKEAIAEFTRAVALNPVHKESLFNLMNCYQAQGDLDKALFYKQKLTALQMP